MYSVYVECPEENICCVAAKQGDKEAIMITNRGEKTTVKIDAVHNASNTFEVYRLSNDKDLEKNDTVDICSDIEIDKYETILLLSW